MRSMADEQNITRFMLYYAQLSIFFTAKAKSHPLYVVVHIIQYAFTWVYITFFMKSSLVSYLCMAALYQGALGLDHNNLQTVIPKSS